jgi:hypothetical protein
MQPFRSSSASRKPGQFIFSSSGVCSCRAFHFGIFYSIESEAIIVHAVLHLSREPDKIRRLLQTAYEGPTG